METLNLEKIKFLQNTANNIRKDIIEMLCNAGSGHTAGALGMVDIFTILYFYILKYRPNEPLWVNRDRLILSNGHICPVLYATMIKAGYVNKEESMTLRKFGSRLQGHPHRLFLPFLETSSGPLGEGLSQAIGMAIIDKKLNNKDTTFYVILSDGEHDEGNIWEGIMLANKEKLSNIIAIVDRNKIQISGDTEKVMPLLSLKDKYEAFGWNVFEINGHNFLEINNAIYNAKMSKDKPSVIIANTIPGKGIKQWENDYHWHGKVPNENELKIALEELNNNYA